MPACLVRVLGAWYRDLRRRDIFEKHTAGHRESKVNTAVREDVRAGCPISFHESDDVVWDDPCDQEVPLPQVKQYLKQNSGLPIRLSGRFFTWS